MTSMFPTPGRRDRSDDARAGRPGPIDYNRAGRRAPKLGGPLSSPASLRWAYWIVVVAAIVMLTTGFVGFFGLGETGASASESDVARVNRWFVAGTNVAASVILALTSASLANGSRLARRVIAVAIVISLFVNVAALVLGLVGLVLVIIPVLLAFALLFMFRPEANEFIAEKAR